MKKIKRLAATVALAAVLISQSLSANALAPVIIGDANKDLSIDVLDLVYAKVKNEYFTAIDYDYDGTNDFDLFRQKLLSGEAARVTEYAVNTEYFDMLEMTEE